MASPRCSGDFTSLSRFLPSVIALLENVTSPSFEGETSIGAGLMEFLQRGMELHFPS